MYYATFFQPYLSKLFGNIKRLEFADERVSPAITAMVSAEDERIIISRYILHAVYCMLYCSRKRFFCFFSGGALLEAVRSNG